MSYDKRGHILVFDSDALLTADDRNPEQDWLHNLDLADLCVVPGSALAEINEKSQGRNAEANKAKKFMEFCIKWKQKYITPDPEEILTQVTVNEKDRNLIGCALFMAKNQPERIVILVGKKSDRWMKLIVGQANLPNLCNINPGALKWWYFEGRPKGRFPEAVWQAHQRMRNYRGRPPQPRLREGSEPRVIDVTGTTRVKDPILPPSGGENAGGGEPGNKGGGNTGLDNGSDYRHKPPFPVGPSMFVGVLAIIVLLAVGVGFLTRRNPPTSSSPLTSTERSTATPAELLSDADNGIAKFQQTGDSFALREPMDKLQRLKDSQGGYLDIEGEQKLSRLKHKYAIEVLASRSQVQEARNMLREIPRTYREYDRVQQWLDRY